MARIVIELVSRRLYFYRQAQVAQGFPIAIGKPATPTPTGLYAVRDKSVNPGGILGSRWLGLTIPSNSGPYGIHGTTLPWSIGQAVSNGCIRMFNQDIESIFPLTPIGTPVEIVNGASAPIAPPIAGRQYVVQPGDTLWSIAQRHGIGLDALIAANSLANPDLIYPGQVLNLPG